VSLDLGGRLLGIATFDGFAHVGLGLALLTRLTLYRVHECVFEVLALESEPVDPRL
jgi:hypothetical protein